MVIKPIGDVPAHGHNSVVAVAFHIIDREADKFGRETTTAKRWLGVRVVERDLVAVDRVVEHRNDVARNPQDITPRVWLMG